MRPHRLIREICQELDCQHRGADNEHLCQRRCTHLDLPRTRLCVASEQGQTVIFPGQALGTESFFRLLPTDHRPLERSRRRRSFPMLLATGNDYCLSRKLRQACWPLTRTRPPCLQARYPLLHPFRTSPAGADPIDAPAATDTMDLATMVITDRGGTMVRGSMSDLATATMVGGVGRVGFSLVGCSSVAGEHLSG